MKYLYFSILLMISSQNSLAMDYPLPYSDECDTFREQKETLVLFSHKIEAKIFKIYWMNRIANSIDVSYEEWESYCFSRIQEKQRTIRVDY